MLYDILPAAGAANSVIQLHPRDNVAIARIALIPGQPIETGDSGFTVRQSVPAGHKVATRPIASGDPIFRYGEIIGFASGDIAAGDHIHTHNVTFSELDHHDTAVPDLGPVPRRKSTESFLGYLRNDGRAGTRNYIAVVAASNCAAHTSELISASFADIELPENVDGIMAFPHGEGCGMAIGPDSEQLQRTLEGVLAHPNVAAAVILGLGCEVNQIDHYLGRSGDGYVPPEGLVGLTLQESGGTRSAIEAARQQIKRLIDVAASNKRTQLPASYLNLGLNCGGSDSFSGITANPALGYCSDLLVEQGATIVLAETTEIFGAEHLLFRRARNEEIAKKLLHCVDGYKAYLRQFGGSFDDNPSPGNKAGGLTNILEKSLGAVAKAGTTPLEDVVAYAERIRSKGFVFMNTPGYDPVSLTGLAAGGVNLIAFTTGRGSAIGFPTIPVLKIASNSATYRRMSENMDINAGRIADGEATVEQVGREIFEKLLRVASGERTDAELLGHHEFVPWRIGPVM
ncbi:MAG TPA: altronate dehydratase family protein [Bryobacteraceae bacterium]|nr:altronate dehydratase family protein [Bryobacteraceae bacterium]